MVLIGENMDILVEYNAVGIQNDGRILNGSVVTVGEIDETLEALVIAAHGKTLGSSEGQALQAYLGSDSRWDAYVALRTEGVMRNRTGAAMKEAFMLMLQLFNGVQVTPDGDYFSNLRWPKAEGIALKQKIQAILDDFPDPE
jgi:hypothetical protein